MPGAGQPVSVTARLQMHLTSPSHATVRDFPPAPSDEPAGLGGSDTAANPVEQVVGTSPVGHTLHRPVPVTIELVDRP